MEKKRGGDKKPEGHGTNCDCGECISTEDEYEVDLTDAINVQGVYCLNERIDGSCKRILKQQENKSDRTLSLESNEGDPELLLYIPFNSAVRIKYMTMIGGEDGTSPSLLKLFVNTEHPDFNLIENGTPQQELECIENPEGELGYTLRPAKFNNVFSLTVIVSRNYAADFSKIYYIGFTGIRTNKKQLVLIGNYEVKPMIDSTKNPTPSTNMDLIFG